MTMRPLYNGSQNPAAAFTNGRALPAPATMSTNAIYRSNMVWQWAEFRYTVGHCNNADVDSLDIVCAESEMLGTRHISPQ